MSFSYEVTSLLSIQLTFWPLDWQQPVWKKKKYWSAMCLKLCFTFFFVWHKMFCSPMSRQFKIFMTRSLGFVSHWLCVSDRRKIGKTGTLIRCPVCSLNTMALLLVPHACMGSLPVELQRVLPWYPDCLSFGTAGFSELRNLRTRCSNIRGQWWIFSVDSNPPANPPRSIYKKRLY